MIIPPLSEEEFYAPGHLRWMSREAILKFLPDLQQDHEEEYNTLFEVNPESHATVFFLADHREMIAQKGTPACVTYEVSATWFGRWQPDGLYVWHTPEGDIKLASISFALLSVAQYCKRGLLIDLWGEPDHVLARGSVLPGVKFVRKAAAVNTMS